MIRYFFGSHVASFLDVCDDGAGDCGLGRQQPAHVQAQEASGVRHPVHGRPLHHGGDQGYTRA